MRILLVNSYGSDESVGGAERYVGALAEGLTSRGHDVSVLAAFPGAAAHTPTTTLHATDWRESTVRRLRNHAGDVLSLPQRTVARSLREHRPEVVHTNNLPGISTAVWELARRQDLPVVHSLHDYYLLCPRVTLVDADGRPCCSHERFCRVRARRLARWSPAVSDVVGVSQYVLARHHDVFPNAREHVIRHPTPAVADLALPPPEALRSVGFIGSLEATKGVRELLLASDALAKAGLELHVAGDGRLRRAVEEAAAGGRLVYHGLVDGATKVAFFARCDLGLVPSVWPEPGGPPYVVLEWLAARRPVLVSTRGGLGERLEDFPGLIPSEPSAESLVQSIGALRSSGRFEAAAAAMRPAAVEVDETGRWLDEHEAVYALAASGPRAPER